MRKHIYRSLLAALLSVAALRAQAQLSFGARLGLNLANVHYEVASGQAPDPKLLAGGQLGVLLNLPLGPKLAVQPAILFSQKGFRIDERTTTTSSLTTTGTQALRIDTKYEDQTKATVRLNYVEVPFNVVYTFAGTHGWQVLAGPYVGYAVGGREKYAASNQKTTTTTTILNSGNTTPTVVEHAYNLEPYTLDVGFTNNVAPTDDQKTHTYFRPFDYGLNFGVGYLSNHMQVQALYGLGVPNISPQRDGNASNRTIKNRVIQLTVGYLLNNQRHAE